MIGQTIGRYRIEKLLGRGGMGDVYLAEDTRLGRRVALKFLAPAMARDAQALARFENEARAAAELSHPNIAAIYDVDEADGRRFLVLEYVEGRTLQARLDERGQLSIAEVVSLAEALAAALAHAHDRGVVHRDIKAANVMLAAGGGIKVLDFGLARRRGESQLTMPGSSLGTVSHMSPEQARGGEIDGRTDLWSLGIVLYQCLTGRLPFAAEQPLAIIHQILNQPPHPPSTLRPETPPVLEHVVMRCLEKDPQKRFANAAEVVDALQYGAGATASADAAAGASSGARATQRSTTTGPAGAAGGSLLRELWRRRVVQTGIAYALLGWLAVLGLGWMVGRARLSPAWIEIAILALAMLAPAVLMVAWWRGRPAAAPPLPRRAAFALANVALATAALVVLFRGRELGAVATTVQVTDEQGQTTSRVVPNSEYRQHVALFVLDAAAADTSITWACYAVPHLMATDLLQDRFLEVAFLPHFLEKLRAAGYPEARGAPRALLRKLAGEQFCPTFVSGTLSRAGGAWSLAISLDDTQQGRERGRTTLTAPDLFALTDQATVWLRRELKLPEKYLEEQADAPVADLVTASETACRAYTEGMLAMTLRQDYPGAATILQKAVEADSDFTLAYFLQYLAYANLDQAPKATAAIEATMRGLYRLPDRTQFGIKALYYFNEKKEPDKALAVAQMWAQLHPDDLQAHATLAQFHYLRGETRETIAACERVLQLDPSRRDMLHQIGGLYVSLGENATAEKYYKRYADEAPTDPRSFSALASLYEDTGQLDEALQSLDRALLLDDSQSDLHLRHARLLSKRGQLEEAAAAMGDALSRATTPTARAEVKRGTMAQHRRWGQLGKAIQAREEWLREATGATAPAEVGIFTLVTLEVLAEAGQLERARAEMQTARALLPPAIRPLTALGTMSIYSQLGVPDSVEAAIPRVEEYIRTYKMELLRPVTVKAAGDAAEERGRWDAAIEQYQKVLVLDPSDADALRRIAGCHRQAGRLDEAQRAAEKSVTLDPFAPRANVELARILLARNDRTNARKHVQRALDVWAHADLGYAPRREAQELLQQIDTLP